MPSTPQPVASLQNAGIKEVVKLRQRSHRDDNGLLIVEGYREVKRALDNRIPISSCSIAPPSTRARTSPPSSPAAPNSMCPSSTAPNPSS
jgi:hypothetical protein